jgi:hypothetical protein
MLDQAINRGHGTTGALITSGVGLVLATVAALFFIAASVQPAAKAEFLVRKNAEYASVCERLGRVPGTEEHAGCMRELTHRDACFAQDF